MHQLGCTAAHHQRRDQPMRWMLGRHGWPVGAVLIPAGTIIDSATWNGPMPPPIDATALDPDAALTMAMAYEEFASIGGWHSLHFHPSVNREAVLATARHKKKWPNGEPAPQTPPPSPTPTKKRSSAKGS
jgi:hypothetical protein